MLIRSQDKKILVNMDVISSIHVEEAKERKAWEVKLNLKKLGEYSNEEKSIKVLDMIATEYLDYVTASNLEFYFAFNHPKVFNMPQDEEVKICQENQL